MKGFNPFMDGREDEVFRNLEYQNFRPLSPKLTCFQDNLFQNNNPFNFGTSIAKSPKDGIEALFENKKSSLNQDIIGFDFDLPAKGLFNKDREDDYNFLYNEDFRPESFRKPFEKKEAPKSLKDSETVSHTKEVSSPKSKRECNSIFNFDTKSEIHSQAKKSVFEGMSFFQDLCPIKEDELPALNTLVSISVNQGSSSLSLNFNSSELNSNKLLKNFFLLAEDSEILELSSLMDQVTQDISSKIAELKSKQIQ